MLKIYAPANEAATTLLVMPAQPAPWKLIAAQFTVLPVTSPSLPRLSIGQWVNSAVEPLWLLHGGVLRNTATVIMYGIGLPPFQTPATYSPATLQGIQDLVTGDIVLPMYEATPLCVQRALPDIWMDPSLRASFSMDGGTFAAANVRWVYETYGE